MAWVPLVGSALGSLIGGLLSDFFIRKLLAARSHVEGGDDDDDDDVDDVERDGDAVGEDASGRLRMYV